MRLINKILATFGVQVNKISSLALEKKNGANIVHYFKSLSKHLYTGYALKPKAEIAGIVFSKDRAMQLHALISSYFYYTKNPAPLTILYTCSSREHQESYDRLQEELVSFSVQFVKEIDFSDQLKRLIAEVDASRIIFMTDDGVFVDHYDMEDCMHYNPLDNIISLRLGKDLDFCYTYNRKQEVPLFKEVHQGNTAMCSWNWQDMMGSPDWSYPLSVDATVFLKAEVETLLGLIDFSTPNSLEEEMQHYSKAFIGRTGICYKKVKYVNVPCNIVQQEFNNVFTGYFSAEALLRKFQDGERIEWKCLNKMNAPEIQQTKYTFYRR